MQMKFVWDEIKNKSNQQKHGIWFDEAQTIWADPGANEFFDPEHSNDEERFIRIGYSVRSRILLVVFCELKEGEVVRIVSARKATSREKKDHEEGI
jgi:uncharacterized DUF497 family protein